MPFQPQKKASPALPEPGTGLPADSLRSRWAGCRRLLGMLFRLAPGAMLTEGVLTLVVGLLPVLSLAVLRHMIEAATRAARNGGATILDAIAWALGFALVGALVAVGNAVARMLRDQVQEVLRGQIQEQVIRKAQSLPLATFEQPLFYDQLQRIEQGVEHRLFSTLSFLLGLGSEAVTLVGLLVYVAPVHPAMPLLLGGGTLLFVLPRVRLFREKYIMERGQTERQRMQDYLSQLMVSRTAAAEVRLFRLGDPLAERWSRLFRELRDERLAYVRREAGLEGASSNGQAFIFGLSLMVVIYLMSRGALSLGLYAAFVGAVQQFQKSAFDMLVNLTIIDNDLRYVRDFFQYLDVPAEPAGTAAAPEAPLRTGILFEGVSFTYPGTSTPALHALDLRIRPGERIALVGENGAGKSTLARLLLGLYHPSGGRIQVDGVDLSQISPDAWRERTAAIFQEFQQYQLTLRENIAVGAREKANDEAALLQAAELAGVDGLARSLPDGYDTRLGKVYHGGTELSFGQWQKIAVARAYMREAELLILDEPTAALDARAEVEVYRQFRDAARGKTVLLISHRLGSARLADRILVLNAGRVVEEGTHAELLAANGVYARMFNAQAQWYS